MFFQFLGFINHGRRGLLNLSLKPIFHALTLLYLLNCPPPAELLSPGFPGPGKITGAQKPHFSLLP